MNKILEKVSLLKKILFQILKNSNYEAEFEIRCLKKIIYQISPYSVPDFEMELKNISKVSVKRMNVVCFLIKKNNVLEKISFSLLKDLGYLEGAIIKEAFSVIFPSKIIPLCPKLEMNVIQNEEKEEEIVLPFLVFNGFLKCYKTYIKLLPEVRDGLSFIYVLNPIRTHSS